MDICEKKDKINLKPKMDEKQMKKLKELQAGLREKRAQEGTLKKTVSDYHKEEVVKEGPNWSMDHPLLFDIFSPFQSHLILHY